ncbi:MAG TPA: dienelactone hydrolase family protein [Beijerinckiaceae bacterium]|jgi:carboxymethylenebutenolidase
MSLTRRAALGAAMAMSAISTRPATAETPLRPLADGFTSGGKPITVEWFLAPQGGRRPGVIMLHGADGLGPNGERYRAGARAVASQGYHVALVHYLDRTDERRASFATLFRNFTPWLDTLSDAITYVAKRPEVDASRIGVVGISLGAALALSAAVDDKRIKAVVDYFGPLPQPVAAAARRLPPTLVLHGASDPVVPVANAHSLRELLEAGGVPHEVMIYPGQGHGLWGEASEDASRRVAAFLNRYLAGSARS